MLFRYLGGVADRFMRFSMVLNSLKCNIYGFLFALVIWLWLYLMPIL